MTHWLVSVIIPCYNHGRYLAEAIESVLAQTWSRVEIVIVDDGSTDDTASVASKYPGARYIYQTNQGLAAARNRGVSRSNGEYLIFLDADDRLTPTAIQDGVDCFRLHPGCGLVFGAGIGFADSGTPVPASSSATCGPDSYEHLLRSNFIWMPHMAMYSRAAFEEAGGYDAGFDGAADYALNMKIARLFPIASHQAVVAEARYRADSMSRDFPYMLKCILQVMQKEKLHVADDASRLRAWRIGVRNWKAKYCRLTAQSLANQIRSRSLAPTFRGEVALLSRFGLAVTGRTIGRDLRNALKKSSALRSSYYLLIAARQMVANNWQSPSVFDRIFEQQRDPWQSTRAVEHERVSITQRLLDGGKARRFANAFELGCAEGIFTEIVASRCDHLHAVDYSDVALVRAAERLDGVAGVTFGKLDIRNASIHGQFDLVLAMGVLTYLVRPWEVRSACEKLIDALEPCGILLFSDTRQSEVFEKAWWGRLTLRGGEQIRRMLSAHPKLILESSADTDTHVFATFRRCSCTSNQHKVQTQEVV